jgi:hypothetical protein
MTANSLIPLLGVVLGGALAFGAQWVGHRMELRMQRSVRHEARRAERLTHLLAFLAVAQEAERAATERHLKGVDSDKWQQKAEALQDRLWAAQKTLHMLCAPDVAQPAHTLAHAVHHLLWQGAGDQSIPDYLRPSRNAFLDAARADLDHNPA